MTPRQKELLDFVRGRVEATGCAPSFAQMQEELGLASKASIHRMIGKLVELGQLVRTDAGARNLALPGTDLSGVDTPALVAELERRGWSRG